MHELSIAHNIFEIIGEAIPGDKYHLAESVKIKAGKLAGIFPDTLISAFNSIKEDFGLKDTNLIIEVEDLQLHCCNCNSSFSSDDVIFICINCSSSNLEITNGDKLLVSEIILKGDL